MPKRSYYLSLLPCLCFLLFFIFGCEENDNDYYVNDPILNPFLISLSPASGSESGGTLVQIEGFNFAPSFQSSYTCTFGGNLATNLQIIGNTEITCVTPPGTPGQTVDVTITNNFGLSATLEDAFTYNADPVATADFIANTRVFTVGYTVQFTDLSTNAVDWSWDFDGDSIIDSTAQNPTFTYNTAGIFDVTLTINTTLNNQATLTRVAYIRVGDVGVTVVEGNPGTLFPTITTALDGLPVGGGIVVIGDGIYDEVLDIDQGGTITLIGNDPTTTILRPSTVNVNRIETAYTITLTPTYRETISLIDIGDIANYSAASPETFDTTITIQNLTIDGTIIGESAPSLWVGLDGNTNNDRFYGIFIRPRVNASIQNCVVRGIRWPFPQFGNPQRHVAFSAFNRMNTGYSISVEDTSFLDFGKNGFVIFSDPGAGVYSFSMNNSLVEGTTPSVEISQNGIQFSSSTFDPGLDFNIALTNNEFRNFGPSGDGVISGVPNAGGALVANDSTVGFALLLYDIGIGGSTTISNNIFSECQGILYDYRSLDPTSGFTATDFFTSGNSVTGDRYFVFGDLASNYIYGELSALTIADPNMLNLMIRYYNDDATPRTVPDVITVGPGTYTLTSDMLDAVNSTMGLIIEVNGASATINIPNTIAPLNVSAGTGVTIAYY